MNISRILVLGATGATGKHVVQMLLDKGQDVRVIVRSKDKMTNLLAETSSSTTTSATKSAQSQSGSLHITEIPNILDLTDEQVENEAKDCSAILSCLGHPADNVFGEPRRLVTDAVKRFTTAMPTNCKLVLMGTTAVAHPDGRTDPPKSYLDRGIFYLLRNYIPPHADNEEVHKYLYEQHQQQQQEQQQQQQQQEETTEKSSSPFEWCIVRPSGLTDGEQCEYKVFDKIRYSFLGGFKHGTTRANVAHFMVDLALNDKLWNQYKFQMPTIYDNDNDNDDNKNVKDSQ